MPGAPRPYLVKCSVWGGDHIKTFNYLDDALYYIETATIYNKKGIPHIYKLVR